MPHCQSLNLHLREFSKRANLYQQYNFLQKKIAKYLVTKLKKKPKRVLDLGCGSGVIIKNLIAFELFVGVDFAKNMCLLHPKGKNIEIIYGNFDDKELFKKLKNYNFDTIFSSSALQWSKELNQVALEISKISPNFYGAIFTNRTFKRLYDWTNLNSFLPSSKYVIEIFDKYFNLENEIITYRVEFQETYSLFKYIKNSGISGGVKRLSFKETKNLINNYPDKFLEFEVVFLYPKRE